MDGFRIILQREKISWLMAAQCFLILQSFWAPLSLSFSLASPFSLPSPLLPTHTHTSFVDPTFKICQECHNLSNASSNIEPHQYHRLP